MTIEAGRYRARATGEVILGRSAEKKTPFIELYFAIERGEGKDSGGQVRWTGYFSERTQERTIQSLQHCGWAGEDLGEFSDGGLHGLDSNEVEVVVEIEEYEREGETKTAPRVAWVNKLGGYLNVQNAMTKEETQSFGESMRGLVLKMRQKKEKAPAEDPTSFNYGANAPANAGMQQQAAGQRKGW